VAELDYFTEVSHICLIKCIFNEFHVCIILGDDVHCEPMLRHTSSEKYVSRQCKRRISSLSTAKSRTVMFLLFIFGILYLQYISLIDRLIHLSINVL